VRSFAALAAFRQNKPFRNTPFLRLESTTHTPRRQAVRKTAAGSKKDGGRERRRGGRGGGGNSPTPFILPKPFFA